MNNEELASDQRVGPQPDAIQIEAIQVIMLCTFTAEATQIVHTRV